MIVAALRYHSGGSENRLVEIEKKRYIEPAEMNCVSGQQI
jgi:hypothetical protein